MLGWFEIANLVVGTGVLGFASIQYVRKRLRLRGTFQAGEPISQDGWLTSSDEAEYSDLYNDQQRQAFGQFGHLILWSSGLIAAGFHIEIRHSIAQMIGAG